MVISLKFILNLLALVFRVSGKRSVWVLNDIKSEWWEKIRKYECRELFLYIGETRRIQNPVQFTGKQLKPQRQLIELEYDICKYIL